MSRLGAGEEAFIQGGAEDGVRVDGRAPLEVRTLRVRTNVMEDCYGSAAAALGATEVVASVSAEIGTCAGPAPEGRLEVTVSSTPGASSQMRRNAKHQLREQDAFNDLLAHRLREVLHAADPAAQAAAGEVSVAMSSFRAAGDAAAAGAAGAAAAQPARREGGIDYSALHIRGERCWVLTADVRVLCNDGGCVAAASAACRAALLAARLPKVTVNEEVEGDEGIEVSDNAAEAREIKGVRENVPVCVTLAKLGRALVADPSAAEEACPLAVFYLGVTPDLQLSSIMTSGGAGSASGDALGTVASLSDVSAVVSAAPSTAQSFFAAIDEELRRADD